jgi:hypothetical protein
VEKQKAERRKRVGPNPEPKPEDEKGGVERARHYLIPLLRSNRHSPEP